jgi:cell growth-regulating nucleolar protein
MMENYMISSIFLLAFCQSFSPIGFAVSSFADDYKQHTSCISEAERYEKTVYKGPKKNETKGRKLTPQESWMEIINGSLEKSPPAVASYLETLSSYDNVPRKERAFRNFSANSLNLRGANGDAIISSIWNHLSSAREAQTKAKEVEKKVEVDMKSTSSKMLSNEIPSKKETSTKRKVAKAMRKALKKASSNQLKMKELRKLVKNKLDSEDKEITKDDLKKAIKTAIAEEKSLSIEGKTVKLLP